MSRLPMSPSAADSSARRHWDERRPAPGAAAQQRNELGDADRLRVGDEKRLVCGARVFEREAHRGDQVVEREQRAAVREARRRAAGTGSAASRIRLARLPFGLGPIDQRGPQDRVRTAPMRARPLRRRAWSARRRRSGAARRLRERLIGRGARLRARRGHEHELAYAGLRGGARQRRGRKMVHPVVDRVGDLRPDMRDAGEMHDRIHAGDERRPVDRARKIGQQHDLDTGGKRAPPAVAHRRAHLIARSRQRGRQRARR